MFYDSLLNEVVSTTNDKPVLKYIHQNPENGEWVASNGQIMLIDHNEAVPMFELWDPKTGNPINDDLQYYDYKHLFTEDYEIFNGEITHQKGGLTKLGDVNIPTKYYNIACKFTGLEHTIKISSRAVYMYNKSKSRQAFVINVHHNYKFKVMDINGEVINTFDTWQEAEDFAAIMGNNFTVRTLP